MMASAFSKTRNETRAPVLCKPGGRRDHGRGLLAVDDGRFDDLRMVVSDQSCLLRHSGFARWLWPCRVGPACFHCTSDPVCPGPWHTDDFGPDRILVEDRTLLDVRGGPLVCAGGAWIVVAVA